MDLALAVSRVDFGVANPDCEDDDGANDGASQCAIQAREAGLPRPARAPCQLNLFVAWETAHAVLAGPPEGVD